MPYGYNMTLETCGNLGFDFSGENNPRYNDHRTWDEIHGLEKSKKLKKERSNIMKESSYNIKYWKENNKDYNPMFYKENREKVRFSKIGEKNPMAKFEFTFILPNGKMYKTRCLRKFCRENGFKREILTKMYSVFNYNPRDPFYKGWIAKKEEICLDGKNKKAEDC